MKNILILLALIVPFMIGCSDSIVSPESSTNPVNNNSQKSWITLPKNPAMKVEDEYSASKLINGDVGGSVELEINYVTQGSINIVIDAEIEVPAGAFSGEKNITMNINSDNGTATFYPSPETFNKPLVFNMRISGVDLNGVAPNSIDFEYIAPDGTFAPLTCQKVVANGGVLRVDDALIPHFSVYGWVRFR